MSNQRIVAVGNVEEQRWFLSNNKAFFDRLPHIQAAIATAFNRTIEDATSIQGTIFHLSHGAAADFMEILLLCGNGYGIGGLKLLRGMYERAVTARYLHQNPSEVDAFLDFEWIAQDKLIRAAKDDFNGIDLNEDWVRSVTEQANRVKPKYMVPVCKECGKERVNQTWSKLDFVSMAKQTAELGRLIVPAYLEPTRQIHATPSAITARLEQTADGVKIVSGGQRNQARSAFRFAHLVFIDVLKLQDEHFERADLRDQVNTCVEDYEAIWAENGGGEPAT